MTFKIDAEPTFKASLTIVGQGRKQKLELVFRAKPRQAYLDLLNAVSKGETNSEDAVLTLVESWNADAEFNADSLKRLDEQQPQSLWAIIEGYGTALKVELEKN